MGRKLLTVLWSQKILKCFQNHPNPLIKSVSTAARHTNIISSCKRLSGVVAGSRLTSGTGFFNTWLRKFTSAQPVQVIFIITVITKQRSGRRASFQTLRRFTQQHQSVHLNKNTVYGIYWLYSLLLVKQSPAHKLTLLVQCYSFGHVFTTESTMTILY